jgi:hypothetical protein
MAYFMTVQPISAVPAAIYAIKTKNAAMVTAVTIPSVAILLDA